MNREPQIQERAAQHYVGIRAAVTMKTIGSGVEQELPELRRWLAANGIEPSGAPFIRFLVIDMMDGLQIETGVPVGKPTPGHGRIQSGVLPAGKYAVLRHIGPYDGEDGLIAGNAALLAWAGEHGIEFDRRAAPDGEAWVARIEQYLTDPAKEPDPAKWQTDIAILTRLPASPSRRVTNHPSLFDRCKSSCSHARQTRG